jgi:5'-3' exonuclease
MVEFEADDAIGTAAARFNEGKSVEQVIIASPDKDLAQLVSGDRIVCWDRRRGIIINEAGVIDKFGVSPGSIPDWLAVVGDSADGFPGIPGWGAKSASPVLAHYQKLESIPKDAAQWQVNAISRGRAASLVDSLNKNWEEALLFRQLATIRTDVPLKETIQDLEWQGSRKELMEFCERLGDKKLCLRVSKWR